MTTLTNHQPRPPALPAAPDLARVRRSVRRRSFCTLATASAANRPHVAGVLYAPVDDVLYVSTRRGSRKVRNVAENPRVFVCVPVRRLPLGPPSTVQFSATAEILGPDDPALASLLAAGRLRAITSHGELNLPDGCFLRITPDRTLHTYGLGLPLRRLVRDPLNAAGRLELPEEGQSGSGHLDAPGGQARQHV